MTTRARPSNARLPAGRLDPLSLRERGDREGGVRVTNVLNEYTHLIVPVAVATLPPVEAIRLHTFMLSTRVNSYCRSFR